MTGSLTPAERKALLFLATLGLLGAGVRTGRALRGAQPPSPEASAALRAQLAAVDTARARRQASKGRRPNPEGKRAEGKRSPDRRGDLDRARRGGRGERREEGERSEGRTLRDAGDPREARSRSVEPGAPRAGVPFPLSGVPVMAPVVVVGAPHYTSRDPRPAARVDLDRASVQEIEALPRVGPVLARRIVADRDSAGPFGSLEGFQRVRGVGPALARVLAPMVTFSLPPRHSSEDERVTRPAPRRRRGSGVGARSP